MIVARIRPSSPRHAEWLEVFGTDTIALKSDAVSARPGPGDKMISCYQADTSRLTMEQKHKYAAHANRKFGLSFYETLVDLETEHGLPVLAEDVDLEVRDDAGQTVPR